MGCVIAAQLWERLEGDLGPRDDALSGADVREVKAWLSERVHRHGRRLDTEAVVEHAHRRGLDVEPFLRHVRAVATG